MHVLDEIIMRVFVVEMSCSVHLSRNFIVLLLAAHSFFYISIFLHFLLFFNTSQLLFLPHMPSLFSPPPFSLPLLPLLLSPLYPFVPPSNSLPHLPLFLFFFSLFPLTISFLPPSSSPMQSWRHLMVWKIRYS